MAKLISGTRIYGTGTIDTQLLILGNTNASSTTTGALVVTGGAGIGQDLRVGGTIFGNVSGTLTGNAATVSTIIRATSADHFLTFVDSNNASATAENVYTTSSIIVNPGTGSLSIGSSPVASARLTINQTYATATAAESFPFLISGTYSVADTNLKQVIRTNYFGSHTSGVQSNGINILALHGVSGVGGTTTNGINYWSRMDNNTGTTVTNAYNFWVEDGAGTGRPVNLYGLFVNGLTKGSSTNYAVYTAGTTPSYFGGNVGVGVVTPTSRLHVITTATPAPNNATVAQFGQTSDGGISLLFSNSIGSLARLSAGVTSAGAGTDDGVFTFETAINGVLGERLRIDTNGSLIQSGNVGGGGNSIVLRGGTAASSEGPQIVMGYGNNTSSAITGQSNNTWNIDVASGLANNNFRIFRQNNTGTTIIALEITEATGGSQLWGIGVGTTASNVQGELRATNEITAYFSSDERLKENISLITQPLTLIDQIRGVRFDWKDEHIEKRGGEDGYFVRKHDVGVIAQEVEKVLPEVVATRNDGYLAVKYEKIVPLLIESIKELNQKIKILEEKISNLSKNN